MASKIFYRFSHEVGTDARVGEIHFNGPSIRLADLKRELLGKLSVNKGEQTGFDLDIRDTDKQTSYSEADSSVVPKNSTVVVSRIPQRKFQRYNPQQQQQQAIAAAPVEEEVTPSHDFGDVFSQQQQQQNEQDWRREEEEMDMIRMIATDAQRLSGTRVMQRRGGGMQHNQTLAVIPPAMQSGLYTGSVQDFDRTRVIGGGRGRGGGGMMARGGSFAMQQQQPKKKTFAGVPKQLLTSISTEQEVTPSTAADDVQFRGDQAQFRDKMQSISTLSNDELRLRIHEVPQELKCRLTGKLLKDAVRTRCCQAVCSLNEISEALIKSNFTCPLCGSANSKIDDLEPDYLWRSKVDAFLNSEKQRMMQRESTSSVQPAREVEELVLPSNNNYDVVLDLRTANSPVEQPAVAAPAKQEPPPPPAPAAERAPWEAPVVPAATMPWEAPAAPAAAAMPWLASNATVVPAAVPQQQVNNNNPVIPRFYRGMPLPQTGEAAEAIAAAAVSGACFSWTQTGTCRFGNNCRFTHGGVPAKDVDLSHISRGPCYAFERGHCKFGAMCRYDHSISKDPNAPEAAKPEVAPAAEPTRSRNRSPSSRTRGRDRSVDRKRRRRSPSPLPAAAAPATDVADPAAPPPQGGKRGGGGRGSSPSKRRNASPERNSRHRGGGNRRRSRDRRRR